MTLYAVYYLYKQTVILRQLNLQDVKELLENTVITIKEENQRLRNNLKNVPQDVSDLRQKVDPKKASQTVNENFHHNPKDKITSEPTKYTKSLEKTITLESQKNNTDTYKPSIQGQVLQLNKKGLSTEQIAQTLNCGKTEVELILRFHENK